MKGTNLGEFEELVLLITVARPDEAYSVAIARSIDEVSKRKVVHSVVHTCLNRLEKKGFVTSYMAEGSRERGGRRKRIYKVSTVGMTALETSKAQRDKLWGMISIAKMNHAHG
jgi:PadR family transcriptional regulator